MSEIKFTPGPWGENYNDYVLVRGLSFLSHANYETDIGRANTALIKAAPDLYEALELVFSQMDTWQTGYEVAKEVLSKARGEKND